MATANEQTIVQTIRNFGGRLFRFIRGRVPSDEDAEDVLQDVWYQLSRVVDVEGIENLNAWLYRVARNRVTDGYRKQRPDNWSAVSGEDETGPLLLDEFLPADEGDPEDALFREMVWETLQEALDELPTEQRDIFVWNELEGETFQSIADRTGTNIKTLISRKGYAVKYLRQRLADLHDELLNY